MVKTRPYLLRFAKQIQNLHHLVLYYIKSWVLKVLTFSLYLFTANPGRDLYKPLCKFLPDLLIIFPYSFQIQWRIGKLIINL